MPKEHVTVQLITVIQTGFEGLSEDVDGDDGWRFGVAVTRCSRSTQLLYIEPG